MFKRLVLIGFFLASSMVARPVLAEDTGTCTCSYTIYSLSSGSTSAVKTYDLSQFNGTKATEESTCPTICGDWAKSRNRDSGGNLSYTITQTAFFAPSTAEEIDVSKKQQEYLIPQLSIDIPGISFSQPLEKAGKLQVDFLPVYIAGIYRASLGIAAIIAVVMIMVGGVQYILGGANAEMVGAAKTRISNAAIGLVLILSAYVMLVTVNPKLTSFESLEIAIVDPVTWITDNGDAPGSITFTALTDIDGVICPQNTSVTVNDVVQSLSGHVAYRYGGKGGPPPYSYEKKEDEFGRDYSNFCPSNNVCLDCSGFVDLVRQCAGLPAAGASTASIFASAEKVDTCSSTAINGKALVPGDLLGFKPGDYSEQPGFGHVFIYIGNGLVADSHGSGRAAGTAMGIRNVTWACESYPLSISRVSGS